MTSQPAPRSVIRRCVWAKSDPLSIRYHDTEWGVPVHNDRKLYEMLLLEGAQAGLNWLTILKKRRGYRRAFDGFSPDIIAHYGPRKCNALLRDSGIVRNRLKIYSAVKNARVFIAVRNEFGSFDKYIWQFVGGAPQISAHNTSRSVPARTLESDTMSRDLTHRGFSFVGSTICYAFMQAVGMVNDHTTDCFRYRELRRTR